MKPDQEETKQEESPKSMAEPSPSSSIMQEQEQEQEEESGLDLCPSFNSYSINQLADTAARVTMEFEGFSDDNDDFEFVSLHRTEEHIVFDGPINPIFPIFNHDLLLEKKNDDDDDDDNREKASSIRISLAKLILDERDQDPPSSSSSEAEELDGIPPETYCVWKPKTAELEKCKKSKSTGSGSSSSSSKRWRIRDLLRRSNSEGEKNSLVFLTPSPRSESMKIKQLEKSVVESKGKNTKNSVSSNLITGKSKMKTDSSDSISSAHELFYVRNRNRMMKEGDKRRSYLPYRKDLVGFWANMNSITKAFPPF